MIRGLQRTDFELVFKTEKIGSFCLDLNEHLRGALQSAAKYLNRTRNAGYLSMQGNHHCCSVSFHYLPSIYACAQQSE